jgi:hypothetical protein
MRAPPRRRQEAQQRRKRGSLICRMRRTAEIKNADATGTHPVRGTYPLLASEHQRPEVSAQNVNVFRFRRSLLRLLAQITHSGLSREKVL